MTQVQHIAGETFHGRRGAVENAFRYGVDYVLLNPDEAQGPSLFSRNAGNLTSLWDRDHGGAPKQGSGVAWVRAVLAAHDLPGGDKVLLLAQPRVLGHVFNPVSFWLCHDTAGALRVVVAEVNNTFGDRHSYLCHRPDSAAITPQDRITAQKIFHVSPFQPVSGGYEFRFDINSERIGIWIDYTNGNGGLIATLTGLRKPLTNAAIVRACLRRPFGSRRVLALIHWQALKLWLKRAPFFTRPEPPTEDVSK
jgi:uncharacterized protein